VGGRECEKTGESRRAIKGRVVCGASIPPRRALSVVCLRLRRGQSCRDDHAFPLQVKMCTVLQQHLNQTNGFDLPPESRPATAAASPPPPGGAPLATSTPAPAVVSRRGHISPVRLHYQPTYSYLQDDSLPPSLRRPLDPYDVRSKTPTRHFHLPGPEVKETRGRSKSYLQQLLGRRSRSHSRTGKCI